MPVPFGVDAAVQTVWGPQSGGTGTYVPDGLGRSIYVWGYEKTTLIVQIQSFGTVPFDAVRLRPVFGYQSGPNGSTLLEVEDQFELTQLQSNVTAGVEGLSPVAPADAGFAAIGLTQAFPRRWEQANLSNIPGTTFRMDLDNRGAHRLRIEVAINRGAGLPDDVIEVFACRWSTGRSNR